MMMAIVMGREDGVYGRGGTGGGEGGGGRKEREIGGKEEGGRQGFAEVEEKGVCTA